jgi:hypothetical protein
MISSGFRAGIQGRTKKSAAAITRGPDLPNRSNKKI